MNGVSGHLLVSLPERLAVWRNRLRLAAGVLLLGALTLSASGQAVAYGWGECDDGQAGNGHFNFEAIPQTVSALSGVVSVAGGTPIHWPCETTARSGLGEATPWGSWAPAPEKTATSPFRSFPCPAYRRSRREGTIRLR